MDRYHECNKMHLIVLQPEHWITTSVSSHKTGPILDSFDSVFGTGYAKDKRMQMHTSIMEGI
jgi:hypothetical protein